MVRVTHVLSRIPVIKFRKGGLGLGSRSSGAGSSAPQQAASPSSAGSAAQCKMQAAAMSTSSIPDIDLPLRYRRMPLSEEEIEHINGGGITDPSKSRGRKKKISSQTMGVIKVPRGVLIDCGNKKKEVVSLNIVLQKCQEKE